MRYIKFLAFIASLFIQDASYSVVISRSDLDHPALGTSGGAALHTQIQAIYQQLGDQDNSRYKVYTSIANSTLSTYKHNFGVAFEDLKVYIYTGTTGNLTRVANPGLSGWTIVANGVNQKTEIDVTTPSSGGPHTFVVIVVHTPESGVTLPERTVGTVGALSNAQGALVDSLFPVAANVRYFHLDAFESPVLEEGSRGNNLQTNGLSSSNWSGKGFFDRESVLTLDGVDDFVYNDEAHYDSTVYESYGLWVKIFGFGTNQAIFSSGPSDQNRKFRVLTDGTLQFFRGCTTTHFDFRHFIPPSWLGKWVHLAMTVSGSTSPEIKVYINGDLTFKGSCTGSVHTNSASFRQTNIGAIDTPSQSPTEYFKGEVQDFFFYGDPGATTVLTESEIKAIYSRRFTNTDQLAGGHVLDADSFNFSPLVGKVYFWNLNADSLDDSGNGENLTNLNSTPFTGLNIFGISGAASLDGVNQRFESTSAALNPGTGHQTVGGWFKSRYWYNATVNTNRALIWIGNGNDFTDSIQLFTASGDGGILCRIGVGSNVNDHHIYLSPLEIIEGSWVHVACRYDPTRLTTDIFINGDLVSSQQSSLPITNPSNYFVVGARRSGGSLPFEGQIEQVFLAKRFLTDAEIKKIAGSKIVHSGSVKTHSSWVNTIRTEDKDNTISLPFAGVLDSRSSKLFGSWSDIDAGNLLNLSNRE